MYLIHITGTQTTVQLDYQGEIHVLLCRIGSDIPSSAYGLGAHVMVNDIGGTKYPMSLTIPSCPFDSNFRVLVTGDGGGHFHGITKITHT